MPPCLVPVLSSSLKSNHCPKVQLNVNYLTPHRKDYDRRQHSKWLAKIHELKSRGVKWRASWACRAHQRFILSSKQCIKRLTSCQSRWSLSMCKVNSLSAMFRSSKTQARRREILPGSQHLREVGSLRVPCSRFRWRPVVRAQHIKRPGMWILSTAPRSDFATWIGRIET